jgi:hypothetical protein
MPMLAVVVDYGMAYPFVTGRNVAFRILVEVLAVAYVLLGVRDRRYRPRASRLFIIVAAFTAWIDLAVLLSADPARSFWSTLERMGGYVALLHLFAYFIILSSVLDRVAAWYRMFMGSIIASAMVATYALLEFIITHQFYGRVSVTFGNPMYLALYMLFNFFFSIALLSSGFKAASARARRMSLIIASALLLLSGAVLQIAYTAEIAN